MNSNNVLIKYLSFGLLGNILHFLFGFTKLVVVFYFVCGEVFADLSTMPPFVIQKEVQVPNQKEIEDLLVKARQAFKKNRFTVPKNDNTVYFLEKILSLSPKDKNALGLFSEVYETYIALAYKRLANNDVKTAQKYHKKAEEISHRKNITINLKILKDLQSAIIKKRSKLKATLLKKNAVKEEVDKKELVLRNEKKKQMMNDLADFQKEIAKEWTEVGQFDSELKIKATQKTEMKSQEKDFSIDEDKAIQLETPTTPLSPFLSPP
ncbi:MAG: hypothetical protein L3J59_11730 [Methylococcaceae bacterium]|nr:hypothetical protein [Methylococcaceae bacterium]